MSFHHSLFLSESEGKGVKASGVETSESRLELAHPVQAGTIPAGGEFMHCESRQRN